METININVPEDMQETLDLYSEALQKDIGAIALDMLWARARYGQPDIYSELTEKQQEKLTDLDDKVQFAIKTILRDDKPIKVSTIISRAKSNRQSVVLSLGRMGLYSAVIECEENGNNDPIVTAMNDKK